MTRREFLDGLGRALSGEVSERQRQSNLRYYEEYIAGETAKGRTEAEVMEELGDPRLIARSIIDAEVAEEESQGYYRGESGAYEEGRTAYEEPDSRRRGFGFDDLRTEESDPDRGMRETPFGGRLIRFGGWKATLVIVLVVVAVLAILSLLFSAAFAILRSPMFWVILLVWMVWRVWADRRNGGGGWF